MLVLEPSLWPLEPSCTEVTVFLGGSAPLEGVGSTGPFPAPVLLRMVFCWPSLAPIPPGLVPWDHDEVAVHAQLGRKSLGFAN